MSERLEVRSKRLRLPGAGLRPVPAALAGLLLLGSLVLGGAPASATHLVTFEVGTPTNLMTFTDTQLGCSTDGGATGSCSLAQGSVAAGPWVLNSASITFDQDPSVLAITSITNTSTTTQTFLISVTLPITPAFGPPSLIQGSISGSLTDTSSATGKGTVAAASVSAVSGGAIYSGLIDGAVVRTLLDDPFVETVVVNNGSATVGPADFGIPVRESVAVATNNSIGITLEFDLSAGDSASFTSVFDVVPVPEPATFALAGFGLALALASSRRRL